MSVMAKKPEGSGRTSGKEFIDQTGQSAKDMPSLAPLAQKLADKMAELDRAKNKQEKGAGEQD